MDNFAAPSERNRFRPWHLPLTVGRGKEGGDRIHDILRPGGSDCWMIEYSHSGRVRVDWDGGGTSFGARTVLCFPPGVEHNYRMEGSWDHYWITFQPRSEWDDLLSWPCLESGVMVLEVDDQLARHIEDVFKETIRLKDGLMPRKGELIANYLENILLRLDGVNPLVTREKVDPRIRVVLELLRREYGRIISIGELARKANLSESRFCHLFKGQMHRTPMQYLERYRMQRACEMLKMSSEPISQIASRCGYQDALYFSRIFRKHMETSPREYRRA